MNNAIYRYIDFDGVIYNTNEIIDALILQEGLVAEQQDLITKLIRQIDFYNMIKNAKEINNSLTAIQELIKDKRYITKILTHVNSIKEAEDKLKIIKEVSNQIKVIAVPKEICKSHYVNPTNAILVDDYKGNLKYWKNKGGLPIHFDPKLKESEYPVINSLFDLDKTIETHYPKVLKMSNHHQKQQKE